MATTIQVDLKEFDKAQKQLQSLNMRGAWLEVTDLVLTLWEKGSKNVTPVLTGRLRASHQISELQATKNHASGKLKVNAPYAGFVNFGTSRQAPNGYFQKGREVARRGASRVGAPVILKIMKGQIKL